MKLEKAINVSRDYTLKHSADMSTDELDAHRLGILALKRIDTQRIGLHESEIQLLPGETKPG